jgi:hypothetical protein
VVHHDQRSQLSLWLATVVGDVRILDDLEGLLSADEGGYQSLLHLIIVSSC